VDVVVGIYAAGAVLLLIAGAIKIGRPQPAVELVATLGLPASVVGVRVLGAFEVSLALVALAFGGRGPAAAIGAVYVVFAVVVIRSMSLGAPSCGCFGRGDTPPSWIHVVGNIGFAIASIVAAAADRSPVDAMGDQPAGGAPFVLLVGVIAGLAMVGFTALPEALAARQPGSAGPAPFQLGDPADDKTGGSR
jgi:hypothetical protein